MLDIQGADIHAMRNSGAAGKAILGRLTSTGRMGSTGISHQGEHMARYAGT